MEEEHFFKKDRKEERYEKKRLGAKDRSKYKKTDRKKWLSGVEKDMQAKMEKRDLLKGRVLSVVPQGFIVEFEGTEYVCVLRGLLKKEKRQIKNVVTVGDYVLFEKTSEKEGAISYVEPRISVLSRQDALTRRQEHILAANIDQVLITASVVNPPLKPSLIDRYIIAATKGKMDPVIIINKIDLLHDHPEEHTLLNDLVRAYEIVGIRVVLLSTFTGEGLEELHNVMKDKSSVFSGQSGTGKSSLINEVTGLDLPVGEVIEKTRKGSHTTTRAHLIPLTFGGFCIDTPGIKSFGVWNMKKEEIQAYYTEIFNQGHSCKFPNCDHIHEKECAVIDAVEEGTISHLRYESYKQLFLTIDEETRRR